MPDFLEINHLRVPMGIGTHVWEQHIQQHVVIDINLALPEQSWHEDVLEQTLDYTVICEQITQCLQEKHIALIETVAEKVAALLLEKYTSIMAANVRVSKPSAMAGTTEVAIKIHRQRKHPE